MTLSTTARCAAIAAAVILPVAVGVVPANAGTSTSGTYKNCTALRTKYKHGVGKKGAKDHVSGNSKPVTNFYVSTKVYNAAIKQNKTLDKDKDGVACELH